METKEEIHARIAEFITASGLTAVKEDFERPWGGFFCIKDEEVSSFIDLFFSDQQELKKSVHKLQPKILVVAPQKRLSWQYHHRRSELWKVLEGPVAVMRADTDEETTPKPYIAGEALEIGLGQRHRLIGLDNWGVVAEIWKHTDRDNPSDESDIVRVQDDFGR